jgi:predicted nucleic acid-binding protein
VIILDTTVLVYAVGTDHPLRDPARWILAAHRDGILVASTTVEVLQEFLHIRARRRGREDAAALTRRYVETFELLTTSGGDLIRGTDLFRRSKRLGAFDSVIAAVAMERGANAFVSADTAFGEVDGLPWVDLAASDLRVRLAR